MKALPRSRKATRNSSTSAHRTSRTLLPRAVTIATESGGTISVRENQLA